MHAFIIIYIDSKIQNLTSSLSFNTFIKPKLEYTLYN